MLSDVDAKGMQAVFVVVAKMQLVGVCNFFYDGESQPIGIRIAVVLFFKSLEEHVSRDFR